MAHPLGTLFPILQEVDRHVGMRFVEGKAIDKTELMRHLIFIGESPGLDFLTAGLFLDLCE